jgi:hypothetical protein
MGIIISIGIAVGLAYAAYWVYDMMMNQTDEAYCESNYPDKEKLTNDKQKLGSYTFATCRLELCSKQRDEFEDAMDDLDFDEATAGEIDSQCYAVCAAFNAVVDCACQNCSVCHEDCGMGYQARCNKHLTCGTHERKVYPQLTAAPA